jgi:pimeloyl-ACP methyl ester carboxylesterase
MVTMQEQSTTEVDARIRAVTGGALPTEATVLLAGGRAMRSLVWGASRASVMVCLHGAGAHAHWWTALMPVLAADRRVYALDLRGHGRSDWVEPPSYQVRDFVSDVTELLERSVRAPVILVGHSAGGRVTARLAAERPDLVRALVLLDPRVNRVEVGNSRWNETFLAERRGRGHASRESAEASFRVLPEEPGIPAAVSSLLASHAVTERQPGEWALRSDRATLAVSGDRIDGMRDVLARISCPTLFAAGAESHIMTPSEARDYAAVLPHGELATVPGRHHFLLSHAPETAAVVGAFLARL